MAVISYVNTVLGMKSVGDIIRSRNFLRYDFLHARSFRAPIISSTGWVKVREKLRSIIKSAKTMDLIWPLYPMNVRPFTDGYGAMPQYAHGLGRSALRGRNKAAFGMWGLCVLLRFLFLRKIHMDQAYFAET